MWRMLRYLVAVIAVAFVAVWLADHPGRVRIDWLGYRAEPPVGVLLFLIALAAGLTAFVYRLWLSLRRSGTNIGAWRAQRKRKRGYQSLTQGMVAVAAGDKSEALSLARKAESLLDEPPLTLLLSAQAAQLNGDERAAERFFRAMTEDPQMEFLGLRGLVMQAIKRGDRTEALALARRAHDLKPKTDWVLETLFDLQAALGHWQDAASTLKEGRRQLLISDGQAGRRQMILDYQLACAHQDDGEPDQAARLMRKALKASPDFVPAIRDLAQILIAKDKSAKARDLIQGAWKRKPHPALIAPFLEATAPTDALQKVKLLEALYKANPGHMESALAIAAACLEAQLWGEARRYLEPWLSGDLAARVCRLMAEIEENEHGTTATMRDWLARAAGAAPDPAWVCGACGHAQEQWSVLCGKCGEFDRLDWGQPPRVAPISAHVYETPALQGPAPVLAVEEGDEPPAEEPRQADEV